ncbi:uncharacterized protein DS421_2g38280 [Arachis hypogaea]|nr:uncharacterized protein DS421_2g38280 [Arachis hypogaea]
MAVPSAFRLCFLVAVPSALPSDSGSSVCASFRQAAVPSALPSGSSVCTRFICLCSFFSFFSCFK